jgi:hypothetical protein
MHIHEGDLSRGLALSIAAGERPTSEKALQVQRLRPATTATSRSASTAAHLGVCYSRSRFSCCFFDPLLLLRKAESRVPDFLVVRLGRGTLTRGPLDAATLRLLMTFLPLWLPCDGLRI